MLASPVRWLCSLELGAHPTCQLSALPPCSPFFNHLFLPSFTISRNTGYKQLHSSSARGPGSEVPMVLIITHICCVLSELIYSILVATCKLGTTSFSDENTEAQGDSILGVGHKTAKCQIWEGSLWSL